MKEFDLTDLRGAMPVDLEEAHLICVLLVDTSKSMNSLISGTAKRRIDVLNDGITRFITNLKNDAQASRVVDLAIVQFDNEARIVESFKPADDLPNTINLKADGVTSLGKAMETVIDMIRERRKLYHENSVPAYKPWIVVMTDGLPTDEDGNGPKEHGYDKTMKTLESAMEKIKHEKEKGKLSILTMHIGEKLEDIDDTNYATNPATYLSALSTKPIILNLENENFNGFFDWLFQSLRIISYSGVDENPTPEKMAIEGISFVNRKKPEEIQVIESSSFEDD
ncbi:MAG: VWA domain-containing protein [Anaeroplasmataceae bacterium]